MAFDADGDTITVSVNSGSADFVEFTSNKLEIVDTSDEAIETATYTIDITLNDGEDQTVYSMTMVVMPAPETEVTEANDTADPEPEATATETEETTTSSASAPSSGTPSSGGSSIPSEEQEQTEEGADETLSVVSTTVFDWEAAFAELDRKRKK